MKRLAVVGASGHGKVVADIAELNGWSVSFYDDAKVFEETFPWDVIGATKDLIHATDQYEGVIVAIGNNEVRTRISKELSASGGILVTLVHPKSAVSRYASLAEGTVVMANAVVNSDAKVGRYCIINTGATVDHDCVLGDGVHLSPGCNVAGGVSIGDGSWLGIGSSVKECLNLGAHVVVGAGSVVLKEVASRSTVYGVPAK